MGLILSFVHPLEFLLRYTVIAGVIVAAIGVAICMSAKRIVLAKRKTTVLDRKDRLYTTLMLLGLGFLLIGMIIMVLPIEATFYVV